MTGSEKTDHFVIMEIVLYLDMRYLRMVYAITILTSPLHGVNSTIQCGTNISKSEIITKWSVFPGTVTCICRLSEVHNHDYMYEP